MNKQRKHKFTKLLSFFCLRISVEETVFFFFFSGGEKKQQQQQKTKTKQQQQNKTKQNKNKTKQNKTKQNKTKQKQNKTKQNKTKQNKTKQNKTKQNKTKTKTNKQTKKNAVLSTLEETGEPGKSWCSDTVLYATVANADISKSEISLLVIRIPFKIFMPRTSKEVWTFPELLIWWV